ncbi:MAG TPA: 2-succinyl-5-enolpyruvyl-6-hydroxy-3-cyclohexene-1-carboxylic-acid synthase [Actinomycetes bacterium]|nr:2-succinyl-5-enolpyruvyl-6-hydroxy-3-cyclohexene-1-carboxylic-acid synthase [Actinomycetes bacterium]
MNPATALGEVFVDELARCGVRHAVLAPGSRSTPLATALSDAAAAGRLMLHVRVDERSAGFVALGLAKVSRRPVAVLTTSGTAAANLYPAAVEADLAGIPLVLMTADRPPELRSTGANQTIDQIKLFGGSVRWFCEVGTPDVRAGQNEYWRSTVSRAVAHATGSPTGRPGPVHLNVALREPLGPTDDDDWPESLAGRSAGQRWTVVDSPAQPVSEYVPTSRTVVVIGDTQPGEGRDATRLAEEHGWPVVAEPTANADGGGNAMVTGDWLLGVPSWLAANRPDRVLVVGRPTLSRGVVRLLEDDHVEVHVVATNGQWSDTSRTASRVLAALPMPDGHHDADAAWLRAWQEADSIAGSAVNGLVDGAPDSEQHVVREFYDSLSADALLVAGSSLPIRHLFLTTRRREGPTVIANRGASGIDGTVSTAIGASLAWQESGGGPAYALLGDLTFLHDINGLLLAGRGQVPDLTIVVVNNDGGGIFELLEQARDTERDSFERVFATPTGIDLAAVTSASSATFSRATSVAELVDLVSKPHAGLRVVEVQTDRQATAALHRQISDAVSSSLATS